MSKRILIISYHFYPDSVVGAKRPTQLARTLIGEGWEVDIITKYIGSDAREKRNNSRSIGKTYSMYQHPGIINPTWAMIKRIRRSDKGSAKYSEIGQGQAIPNAQKTTGSNLKRYIISMQATLNACKSWVLVSIFLLLYLKLKGKQYDVVLSSSPISSSHLVGLTAKFLYHAKWIVDIRDPINMWDNALPITRSKLRTNIETYLEKKYYRDANLIVVTSPGLKSDLRESADVNSGKVKLIYNGYDGELKPSKKDESGKTRMLYAGSLYLDRSPFPVFEAIKELCKEGKIQESSFVFDLFGNCNNCNGIDLEAWVKSNGLDGLVNFKGSMPQEELEIHLQDADILLNLAQGWVKQIPAKTFDYFKFNAVQFLVASPGSDISDFLTSNNLGIVSDITKEDVKNKLEFIISQINSNENFKGYFDVKNKFKYSRKNQNKRYLALIENVIDRV